MVRSSGGAIEASGRMSNEVPGTVQLLLRLGRLRHDLGRCPGASDPPGRYFDEAPDGKRCTSFWGQMVVR